MVLSPLLPLCGGRSIPVLGFVAFFDCAEIGEHLILEASVLSILGTVGLAGHPPISSQCMLSGHDAPKMLNHVRRVRMPHITS